MARPLDTSAAADRRQVEAFRAMTPEQRLRLADEMSSEVRQLADAGYGRARATQGKVANRRLERPSHDR